MVFVMINKKQISTEQARYAMENSEFGNDIINSKNKVVVVMSQDWCPQWMALKCWIFEVETNEDIDVYELEYNKTEYFDEFMNFKENQWKSHNVPYLRFYKDGILIEETNYIDKDHFMDILSRK